MLITSLWLIFIDKHSAEILKSLHEEQKKSDELESLANNLRFKNKALVSWNTIMKVNFELLDQTLITPTMDPTSRARLFNTVVECIAERKHRLFGIEDDYLNISVYEYSDTDEELQCIACYRSRPSDAKGPHRSWKTGEGHVGKTFELKRELICADARASDVADLIAPPQEKMKSTDRERYISLIAVPIAVDANHPLGVIIMTSDQPQRFVNRSDVEIGSKESQPAVEALQDIASQLAQLMCILGMKELDNGKEQNNEQEISG